MDSGKAQELVHKFLCESIEISRCTEPPDGMNFYEFNPARDHLFTFKLFDHASIGSSEYIAVDRDSGEVRYLGCHCE